MLVLETLTKELKFDEMFISDYQQKQHAKLAADEVAKKNAELNDEGPSFMLPSSPDLLFEAT